MRAFASALRVRRTSVWVSTKAGQSHPNMANLPKLDCQNAAEGNLFRWRWNLGRVGADLRLIWEMSARMNGIWYGIVVAAVLAQATLGIAPTSVGGVRRGHPEVRLA